MNLLVFNLRQDADDGVLGFTTDWVNALARRCSEVVVITMDSGVLRLEPNVTVYSVGTEKGYSRPRRALNFYRLLVKVLRERRIDACFAHMNVLFALLGAPVLKAARIPTLLWYAHKTVTRRLRLAEKLVNGAVTSSASGFQLPSDKVRIIGQGIDTNRFSPLPERQGTGTLNLLSFGRISRIKSLEVILEALARLKIGEPKLAFKCLIVGDPVDADGTAYLAELKSKATQLGLEGEVCFSPGVPFHAAQETFRKADIFLNPGETDSVDKTVLEALSCGVPVITSNVAFDEVLPPSMKGASLIPKRDPDAMATAIRRMAMWTGDERRTFGLHGRALVVAEHSLEGLANRIMEELQKLRRSGDSGGSD